MTGKGEVFLNVQSTGHKYIFLGYLLGIALLLSGVIYFFASNWSGFDRFEKITLSVSLMLVFYLLAYLLSRFFKGSAVLGEWFLVGGSVTFGVTIALLGQIYNSHADSYLLFAFWFIPVFLFALFTRYQAFYILSYILLHLTLWFYLFPSSYFLNLSEERIFLNILAIIVINMLIFILTEAGKLDSPTLKYLSFFIFHCAFIYSSALDVFIGLSIAYNLLYVVLIIGSFYYLTKRKQNKILTVLLGLTTVAYALAKFFQLAETYFSEGFFALILLFVAALVAGNVFLIRWLNGRRNAEESSAISRFIRKALVGIITAVASVLGTVAFVGLVVLLTHDLPEFFFFFSAVGFIVFILVVSERLDETIRYTLLVMGYLLGSAISIFMDGPYILLFIVLLTYCWYRFEYTIIKFVTFLLVHGLLFVTLLKHYDFSLAYGVTVLAILQLLLLALSVRLPLRVKRFLQRSCLLLFLFFFGWLTFIYESEHVMYAVYNMLYFIMTTALVFWFSRRKRDTLVLRISMFYWFSFLFVKYYDFVWKLLHKSIALIVLGILFLLVCTYFDRRRVPGAVWHKNVVLRKLSAVLLIIILQVAFIGIQVAQSEYLLENGTLVKLKLAPVDPRSFLQGDYVQLSYDISTLADEQLKNKLVPNEKIQVVLRKNISGVHELTGVYRINNQYNREYQPRIGDVVINGRYDGFSFVIFGLETYFVPEATGLDVQMREKYAFVKVGQNGDAILVELSEN